MWCRLGMEGFSSMFRLRNTSYSCFSSFNFSIWVFLSFLKPVSISRTCDSCVANRFSCEALSCLESACPIPAYLLKIILLESSLLSLLLMVPHLLTWTDSSILRPSNDLRMFCLSYIIIKLNNSIQIKSDQMKYKFY